MIPLSTVSQSAKNYITTQLYELEKKEGIKILIAVESGSRAWGFPSINSDYDVRFIYIRKKNDYLSIVNHRDVIEIDIIDNPILGVPFDLNGWDIRKVLLLEVKSNAVIIEWLQSPIIYISTDPIVHDLLAFAKKTANIPYLKSHYYRLMMHAWEQITAIEADVKVKLYCYALRPALALYWLNQHDSPPPMNMYSLCKKLNLSPELENEINKLIALKMTIEEHNLITRNKIIDSFITAIAKEQHEKIIMGIDTIKTAQADNLFQKILYYYNL